MKNRKLLALISLMLVAMLCLPMAAQAQTAVNTWTYNGMNIGVNRRTNTVAIWLSQENTYAVYDKWMNRLTTDAYSHMMAQYNGFEVTVDNGTVNNHGLLDGQGNVLLPAQYGDLKYVSDNWWLGVVLTDGTLDHHDYKNSGSGTYYLIDHYDVYYKGQKAGELSRTGFYMAYDRGAYLYVRDDAGTYHYYDQHMNESNYTSQYATSSEYDEIYKSGKTTVYHMGSGQKAFAEGCTLTPDEVNVYMKALGNYMLDLQGNKLFDISAYDYVYNWYGDYAKVKRDNLCGLIDHEGNLVIPCEYDDIPNDGYNFFVGGYQAVIKNGKGGFVDKNGNVTCDFKYAASNMKNFYNSATYLQDMEGNCVVLTGGAGELPNRYAEVSIRGSLIAAKDLNGNAGVLDIYGNVLIPFDGTYDAAFDFELSNDGTMIVASSSYKERCIYVVGEEVPPAEEEVPAEETEAPAEEADAEEENASAETWKCNCGAEVSGNFCLFCGSAKPVEEEPAAEDDGSWKCVCGSENNGNFCPNCGTAKPVEPEKLKCVKCGYEPAEGTTPKFCSECGNAF